MGFTIRLDCKQNEKHDFSHYLVLSQIVEKMKRGVWNKDVRDGFFQKSNQGEYVALGLKTIL